MEEPNGTMEALFHSEITSSYMLYDVLKEHHTVASAMIEHWFHIPSKVIEVKREHPCRKVGAVDVFLEFHSEGKKCALPIEVKVHDYTSARDGQIKLYYDALNQCGEYDAVYFIYITQFNRQADGTVARPKTLDEAQNARLHIRDKFAHISWLEMHSFLDAYRDRFTEEQSLILKLNYLYMEARCAKDIEFYRIDVGSRGLHDYFPDIKFDLKERLPFGSTDYENNKVIWRVNLPNLRHDQLMDVYEVIETYAHSDSVDKIKRYDTSDKTLDIAGKFLQELSKEPSEWLYIPFYSKLFMLAHNEKHLQFNGVGNAGFSIVLSTQDRGPISLCRIHKNKRIDFALMR